MTVEIRDILLKAAEDVQQGMWCKGSWFTADIDGDRLVGDSEYNDMLAFHDVGKAQTAYRCAEGSIQLATALLGGSEEDYFEAVRRVEERIGETLSVYNDSVLKPISDPFEAGQQLAELFRSTAENLSEITTAESL